jgi:hypothetical protein
MIHGDDNIHDALEKVAASGLDKTAVSEKFLRAAIKKRMAGLKKGKLRGEHIGKYQAAEATSTQLGRIRELTKARKDALFGSMPDPGTPSGVRALSMAGGTKKLKAHRKASDLDWAVYKAKDRANSVSYRADPSRRSWLG